MNSPQFTLDALVSQLLSQAEHANLPALENLPLSQARAQYAETARHMSGTATPVGEVHDHTLALDCADVRIRRYLPQGADTPLPALVYFHGGGWVIGDLDTHDNLCRALCAQSGCAVVAVDYRLAPEHKFPAAVEDAYAAVRWVQMHGATLGIDGNMIALGGDSAGGNLAAVVSYLLREAAAPMPRLQMLFYPSTDMTLSCPSITALAEGYRLTRDLIRWFVKQYLEQEDQQLDLRASPVLIQDPTNLPSSLVITAGFDPLRDEGKAYADKLAAAGVEVVYECYEGMIHGFMNMAGILPQARTAIAQAADALRTALQVDEQRNL